MKKGIYISLIWACCVMQGFATPVDVSKLIKVTNLNDPKCVEYYNIKSEMYCSTKALTPPSVDPNLKNFETQKIIFDDRLWLPAWGKQSAQISMVEYVPSGDDINHWNELITSQFFPGLQEKVSPREFANAAMQGISESGFAPMIKYYGESSDYVLFEFRILTPKNQQQDELQMIRKGDHGLYALHYVIKKSDMGDKQRDLWLSNLRKVKIKS